MNVNEREDMLNAAQHLHVTRLFLNIGDYLDGKEGVNNSFHEKAYEVSLSEFISLASQKGIAVEALSGGPMWAESSHRYLSFLIIDFVHQYNLDYPSAKFSGIQFDIEPHSLPEFKKDPESVMQHYIQLIIDLTDYFKKKNYEPIPLGFTTPSWYYEDGGKAPEVKYAASSLLLGKAILQQLNNYGEGYVVLMSYRNHATGTNGSVAISQDALSYAEKNTPHVRVYIGQETTNVGESGVSYYGKTYQDFQRNLEFIQNAFENKSVYSGIAVHRLSSLISLSKN
ncbi:MAG TPA: hypothetical protein VFM02_00930 [Candidatus Paceibacterota bacterium]|nr:hypothetical protein [Candidatus Paceibacterota bacterium]